MSDENARQRAYWNDEGRAKSWPRSERISGLATAPLLAALAAQEGERVLDIGCGGGGTTLAAAAAAGPTGSVTGFDISAPMLELAADRAREAGAANVRFVAGDAQTDEIPGGPFDAAMSQFGIMFFADPVRAFANIRRHLRPGGRLAFACWQEAARNSWYPGPVFAKYAPPPPPAASGGPAPGPFAFGDAAYMREVLEGAGFADVAHEPLELAVRVPDGGMFQRSAVDVLKLEPARADDAWRDLQAFAAGLRGDDGMLGLQLAARIVTAGNPQ